MMDASILPLSSTDRFRFGCGPDVPCFNECCRDLNQLLTPYDILRLKQHLGLSATQFLERYTIESIGHATALPIVSLKPDYNDGLKCPFVTPNGCAVYPDRPSSCRIYPVIRVVHLAHSCQEIQERFGLLREPHCMGFDRGEEITAARWMDLQDVKLYNRMNDRMIHLIALKRRCRPGPLSAEDHRKVHEALYDVDRFRARLLASPRTEEPLAESPEKRDLSDDLQLLAVGLEWVARFLSTGEGTTAQATPIVV